MKKLLLIAYHYPPFGGSSGLHRTVSLSRYLPENGWETAVLTIHPRAYVTIVPEELDRIPAGTRVVRAFGLDTARHVSVFRRYPRALALPDRWASWWLGAVPAGLNIIRRWKPDVIWSTYPIATAHLIALTLRRLTGLPWLADFRDPMTQTDYPADAMQRRVFQWLERRVVRRASGAVFTTPGSLRMYAERYPHVERVRWHCVENGYDEETFLSAENDTRRSPARRYLKLLHSGSLYPLERDPSHFFAALAVLRAAGEIDERSLQVVLRATGHDDHVGRLIAKHGVGALVSIEPAVPYRAALAEMLDADALLLFQGSSFNHQIPAKLYEYLRAGRPILAMADAKGDTAATLRSVGINSVAAGDDTAAIVETLRRVLDSLRNGRAQTVDRATARQFSRRSRVRQLAQILDTVCTSS